MVDGIGDVILRELVGVFKDPREVFEAPKRRLIEVEGVGDKVAGNIKGFNHWDEVAREIERCQRLGVNLTVLSDPDYPPNLKEIYNPPPVIYGRGSVTEDDKYAIGIVGARTPDKYGRLVAEKLAEELALMGITVVSGMARGIDSTAHRGALRVGGRTLAVMGSGIDVVYPPENRKLFREISENGACLSEFPLGIGPDAANFPKRNRIISGLSLGVVVIQASSKSGALITASYALEQNREIFSVPGNINTRLSVGTNRLIKAGAKLVEGVEDIVEEIGLLRGFLDERGDDKPTKPTDLNKEENAVYSALGGGPLAIDDITRALGVGSSNALSTLLTLELKGLVVQHPGKVFELRGLPAKGT